MRIIAGKYRGRKLNSPVSDSVRPTSDRLREALFNILYSKINGAKLLDLFTGSGAVAIEAMSRGALAAVCVDIDTTTAQKNIALVGSDGISLIKAEYRSAIDTLAHRGDTFDIIYIDPPYKADYTEIICETAKVAKKGTLLIAEHTSDKTVESQSGFEAYDVRRYGASSVTFMEFTGENKE